MKSRSVLFWTLLLLVGVSIMFFLLFALVWHATHAEDPSPVEDLDLYPPRIYYDWSNRQPDVAVGTLNNPRTWKSAQPFVFKLESNYLMMFYDHRNGKFEFALNPASYRHPALTVGDIEALLDPKLIRKVNMTISELRLSSHLRSPDEPQTEKKLYPLPDKYRLDDICLLEKYNNLCVNKTGEARVRLWQVPLSKSGFIRRSDGKRRSTLRLAAMWDPDVGETLFNTFPGKFSLPEWRAMTTNESIAEILDFYETIE